MKPTHVVLRHLDCGDAVAVLAAGAAAAHSRTVTLIATCSTRLLPPPRLIVHFRHPELPVDAFALDNDVNEHGQQTADIVAGEVLAALALLDEQG